MSARDADRALLEADHNPFADPVVRLDPGLALPPHVETLHAAARAELHRAVDGVASSGGAAMLLVVGEPGQGKTHELCRLRAELRSCQWIEVPPLKDAGAPFQHVLRYVAQGLLLGPHLFFWEALRQVARAVRDEARGAGDEATADRIDAALPHDPRFLQAFRTLVREDPALIDLLEKRGRTLPPLAGIDADVAKVLCRILDRDAEALALDWLRGAELPDDELFLLGVRRPLESEERCYEVLRALATLSARPLLLCFDQLESTRGHLGDAGAAALFNALMDLYQHLHVCIVLMCQGEVWGELTNAKALPLAAMQRIRRLPDLGGPTAVEAARLVEARLLPLWSRAGARPPYPSYPFSPPWIAALVNEIRPSVRQVLARCGEELDAMRAAGAIAERSGPAAARPPKKREVAAVLAEERAHKLRAAAERADLATPPLRQERLRNAIGHLLAGAAVSKRPVAGAHVRAVEVPPKPRSGQRAPMVASVALAQGEVRLALEVHSDQARGAVRALERLRERVAVGAADAALLVREADAPIGAGARRTHELIAALEPRGGVLWIERADAHRLVAAELLLDAASAAEVWAGERSATRDEALSFLLEHGDLDAVLAPLVSRVGASPPAAPAARLARAPSEDDLGERILELLRSESTFISAPRIATALDVTTAALEPAIAALSRAGRVGVALDRERTQTVFLLPEGAR